MLNENFVILAVVVGSFTSIIYLIDTIKGKVQPNKVTFFLWALAPLIAFTAQIKQGVGIQSLLTFLVGFEPLLIFFASFLNKKSAWKLGSFDFICGALSLAGILAWYITQVGNLAIAFSIVADGLAALPTIVKVYRYPETENGLLYLGGFISALLTLLTIPSWTFAYYGFNLYLVVVTLIIFSLIQFKLGKKLSKA